MEQKKKGLSLRRRFGNVLRRMQMIALVAYHLEIGTRKRFTTAARAGETHEGSTKKEKRKKDIDLSKVVKGTWQIPNTRCLVSLGEGAFGPMNICENRVTGQIALEKVVRKDEAILGHLKEEIRCLTLCKSAPEILNMTAFSDSLTSYQLYLERFSSVPLNRLNANKMSPWILGSILESTGKALRFIHSKGIVHRQLTGQNILVSPTLEVKITGFDVATVGKNLYGCVGVLGYMAPEVANHSYRYMQIVTGCNDYDMVVQFLNVCPAYNHSVDYYTLGATVFEMFFDRPPAFRDLEIIKEEYIEDAILFNMFEGPPIFIDHELEDPETYKVFAPLLRDLFRTDPVKRCVDNKFKKNEVFREVMKQKPKKATAVDLESFVKDYKPQTAALAKLWYDPLLQFGRGGNLKDIFFYLTTRPSLYRRWKRDMNEFYPDPYDEYIAYWNQVQSGPAVEATVESAVQVGGTGDLGFFTSQRGSLSTPNIVFTSQKYLESVGEEPISAVLSDTEEVPLHAPVEPAVQVGDTGDEGFFTSQRGSLSTPNIVFTSQEYLESVGEEPISAVLSDTEEVPLHAPVEPAVQVGDTGDEGFFTSQRGSLSTPNIVFTSQEYLESVGEEPISAVLSDTEEVPLHAPVEPAVQVGDTGDEGSGSFFSSQSGALSTPIFVSTSQEYVESIGEEPISAVLCDTEEVPRHAPVEPAVQVGDTGDEGSGSFFSSQSGALSTPIFVSTSQEYVESIGEEPISAVLSDTEEVPRHAPVEPTVQVGDTGDEGLDDDNFITCVILWIAFVLLCLFFLGKSVFNIFTRSGLSKNSTDDGDEGGIDHGDSPGKRDDLGAHADDIEDHEDVFGQDGEDFGDHVDELADPRDSPDPGDL